MYLTGFADEAGKEIQTQIKATKELGWDAIEARTVGSGNLHVIPDDEFAQVEKALDGSGVRINCFGSTIANWGKQITDPFEETVEDVRRTIPRMQRLGSKMIRIMSYAVLKDRGPEDQEEAERFRRLREILKMFDDAGILPVHENCMNYGGMGWVYTLRMIENVPGLKLVFDTGNPIFSDDRAKGGDPCPKQSAWEFYEHVKPHIAYVHIKDGIIEPDGQKCTYGWPGEGQGEVKRIVKDLLDSGYDGGFSMEPHIKAVFHDDSVESTEEVKYRTYVEYGRRFAKLIGEVGHGDKIRP